jgi:hypothetical protein
VCGLRFGYKPTNRTARLQTLPSVSVFLVLFVQTIAERVIKFLVKKEARK